MRCTRGWNRPVTFTRHLRTRKLWLPETPGANGGKHYYQFSSLWFDQARDRTRTSIPLPQAVALPMSYGAVKKLMKLMILPESLTVRLLWDTANKPVQNYQKSLNDVLFKAYDVFVEPITRFVKRIMRSLIVLNRFVHVRLTIASGIAKPIRFRFYSGFNLIMSIDVRLTRGPYQVVYMYYILFCFNAHLTIY